MSQKIINVGNAPDDGTGDPLRLSMQKVNDNFTEFYTAIAPTGRNVGIGTSTPSARLNVVADLTYDAVRITQTGTGNALVVEDSANPDVTSFIINKDGNVGINKNLPTFPLDVNGDMNTSGKLYFNGGTKYIGFQNGGYVLPAADLIINGSKAITVSNFNTYAPTLTGTGASGLWDISVADATYSTGSRANTFTIGTGSTFVANGNLGINKTTPQAKLHVGGNAIVNNNLTVGSLNLTVTAIQGISNTQTGVIGQSNTWVGVYGYSNASVGVRGETSGTDGAAGVVGYSVNSPGTYGVSETHHGVIGSTNSSLTQSVYAGVAGVAYQSGYGVSAGSNTGIALNVRSNTGAMAVFSNASTYGILSIDNWGRLGIANTNPLHKLSVNGPSYFGSTVQLTNTLLVGSGAGSPGTAGQVLTSSGATGAPVWAAASGGGSGLAASPYIVNGIMGNQGTIKTVGSGPDQYYSVSITAETYTVVPFTLADDVNGWHTGNKFQPTIAGYYDITSHIWVIWPPIGASDNSFQSAGYYIRKNGTDLLTIDQLVDDLNQGGVLTADPTNDSRDKTFQTSRIVYMNGTTDYVEFVFWCNPGAEIVTNYIIGGSPSDNQIEASGYSAHLIAYGGTINGGGGSGVTISEGDGQIHSQLFTSTGTWTAPYGVSRVKAYVIGGGAGGGSGHDDGDNPTFGYYGRDGGLAIGEYTVTAGNVYDVIVGIGGHANNADRATGEGRGETGGTSSFGPSGGSPLLYATGGTGVPANGQTGGSPNEVDIGTPGLGHNGTLRNATMVAGAGWTSGIFNGGFRPNSLDSSVINHTPWSIDAVFAPGVGGAYKSNQPTSWNAQGGVDGIVYLEWVESKVNTLSPIPSMTTFTTAGSHTFEIPTGITKIKVTVVGGGGGGRGAAQPASGQGGFGHGGAGGGTSIKTLTGLTPGATLSVTIGAGGTGSTGPTLGGTGGTSSVSSGTQTISTISATGGIGGQGAWIAEVNYGVSIGSPAEGGIGTGGDLNIRGGAGGLAYEAGAGAGGSSHFGGGGVLKLVSYEESYTPATYGGGGAGGIDQGNGRPGASGLVIFEY